MGLKTTQAKAITPAKLEAELVQLEAGLVANVPAGTVFTIGGVTMTQAQIVAQYQDWIGIVKAVDAAKQVYLAAVAARLGITVAARTFNKGLKAVVKEHFGSESAVLASFGIPTDKAVSITSQQHVVAAAKRKQTRTVRGTKGKKQKAALTVVGNPPVAIASDGTTVISPPPINVGPLGPPVDITTFTGGSSPGNGIPAGGGKPGTK